MIIKAYKNGSPRIVLTQKDNKWVPAQRAGRLEWYCHPNDVIIGFDNETNKVAFSELLGGNQHEVDVTADLDAELIFAITIALVCQLGIEEPTPSSFRTWLEESPITERNILHDVLNSLTDFRFTDWISDISGRLMAAQQAEILRASLVGDIALAYEYFIFKTSDGLYGIYSAEQLTNKIELASASKSLSIHLISWEIVQTALEKSNLNTKIGLEAAVTVIGINLKGGKLAGFAVRGI